MNYKYIGDGAGIPGLPHEISDEEAAERDLTELLSEAIKAGKYQAAPPAPVGAPSPLPRNGDGKKKIKKLESEVNDVQ